MDKLLAWMDQMTYDSHTQGTQIKQLKTIADNQSTIINNMKSIIMDQNKQISTSQTRIKE